MHAQSEGLTLTYVIRNRKYFDFIQARSIARVFQLDHVNVVWFRDTRDMDMLAWVKRMSGQRIKLLYQQAMQFGVSKKDIVHTFRFQSIDAWVSTLNFLADQVKEQTHFPVERIHVVPLGTDPNTARGGNRATIRAKIGIDEKVLLAGVIGRIDPLKDQLCAIRALHQISEQFSEAHLLIVGESTRHEGNEYERSLRRHVNQLDLQNRIHFLPHTNKVNDVYAALDLFILTSKGETFGTVTIEAMSNGLAVIGTRSSGTPEIIGSSGLLFEPGNAIELAEQWTLLLSDTSKREELGKAALNRFEHLFSRKASVTGMKKVVLQLAGTA